MGNHDNWQIEVAEIWAKEVGVMYSGFKLPELKTTLHNLLNLFIKTLINDPFRPEEVETIGKELTRFNFTEHTTLQTTLHILHHRVLPNLHFADQLTLYPRLTDLLAVVAISYHRESQALLRKQQEAIRLSLMPDEKRYRELLNMASAPRAILDDLSQRQLQILALMGSGKTNAEISQELSITEGTVGQHLSAIYKVLRVKGRKAAKLKAKELDLI